MSLEAVADWLHNVPGELADDELADLHRWADGVDEEGEPLAEITAADFSSWWSRLSGVAGGEMSHSVQTDVKAMFGEFAWGADQADNRLADLMPDFVAVDLRQSLVEIGLAPGGMWRAELLADRLKNALIAHERWVGFDDAERNRQLDESLAALLEDCNELIGSTLVLRARRLASAVAAVCAYRLGTPEDVLLRVEQFFDYERQAKRERGDECSWEELTYVALAGVTAYASLEDASGVQEVMRLIRQRVEPADGTLPPVFLSIWARGLRHVDPALAQMVARQLMLDVYDEEQGRTDAAFGAAFLLMESSLFAGDQDLVDELVTNGCLLPLSLLTEPGHRRGSTRTYPSRKTIRMRLDERSRLGFRRRVAIPAILLALVSQACSSSNFVNVIVADVAVIAPASCDVVGCVGEGIDTADGEYRLETEDVVLPPGLFGFELLRTYRSGNSAPGWFGRGWSTVYETTIELDGQTTTLVAPAGLSPLWTPEAPPGWDIAGGSVLERTASGHLLRWSSGEAWVFDSDGQLTTLTSPYGAKVTVAHSEDRVTIASSQGLTANLTLSDNTVAVAELSDGRQTTYEYSDGLLTEVVAPGVQFSYRYDNAGRMTESTAPAGTTAVSYAGGKVASQRTVTGERLNLSYEGTVATVESARLTTAYHHDSAGRLARVSRGNRDLVEVAYDGEGRLISRTEFALPSGDVARSLDRTYTAGRLTSETVNGITSTFDYDEHDRVTSVSGPTTSTFEYTDGQPLPTAVTTAKNGRTELEMEDGFIVSGTDATGATTLTRRDQLGNPTANGISPDSMWTYEFDEEGNVTTTTSPMGRTWFAEWGPRGALLRERDPLGRSTIYRYDSAGRLTHETLPGGRTTERIFTTAGLLASVTNPDGLVTRYEYAPDGRLATVIEPGDRTWRISHAVSAYGSRDVTIAAADGTSTVVTLDSQGRQTARRSLEPDRTVVERVESEYEFDRIIRTVTHRGASQLETNYEFDDAGRVISTAANLDGVTAAHARYDYAQDRLIAATNDDSAATYEYDSAGRLIEIVTDGDTWQATYRAGVTIGTAHNGETTRIERDLDGRAVSFVAPDGITTTWQYDDADRPISRSVADAIATFAWTEADQLGEYGAPTGAAWTWTYDAAGRLLGATEPGGASTSYEYEHGAIARTTTSDGRDDRFTYNARGLMLTAETRAGKLAYTYDAADRMVGADASRDDDDETWTLNAAGQVVAAQVGDGRFDLEYTTDGRLQAVRGPGDELLSASWTDGKLRSVEVDGQDPMGVEVDAQGRLTSVTWNDDTTVEVNWRGDESFAVNKAGDDRSAEYVVADGQLTAFTQDGRQYSAARQNNGYLDTLSIASDDLAGEVQFDQLGRPATLTANELVSSITYGSGGRVSSVVTTHPDREPQRTTVTYDAETRKIDGEDDLVNALFDQQGALQQSLPNTLPNPFNASSDAFQLHAALAVQGADSLLEAEPRPFEQVEQAIVSATPQLTSPIGVRDRAGLARRLITAQVERLNPVVTINGGVAVRVPIVNPENGSAADYNPFTDATPSGLALGALARQAGGGGSLLGRAIDKAGDIVGGVVSFSAEAARFVITNPIARLVLSTASVIVAGAACAPTSGLACAPFAALAAGLLAGDATLTIAYAMPSILLECSSGRVAECGLNVAHIALAGTQLFVVGSIATALVRVADRAVAAAAAQGAAAAIASGESGVARTQLLVALRGGRVAAREVPACVDGVCARFDLVVRRLNGRLIPVEVKNGGAARFTVNQTHVYPMLDTTAAYLPYGLLNGGSPQTLLVGRPVVHHWNTASRLRLP
jgi:YD repeat-containing protein